jgi:hypothetical protein
MTIRATHRGEFVEGWHNEKMFGMLEQLGLVPTG